MKAKVIPIRGGLCSVSPKPYWTGCVHLTTYYLEGKNERAVTYLGEWPALFSPKPWEPENVHTGTMKVELENLRLSVTALTGDIVVGIPAPDKVSMKHQKVVTNDFIAAVIQWAGEDTKVITASSGESWEVTVTKVKP